MTQPILIIGANGSLGKEFSRICAQRNLACHLLSRQEMDMSEQASVEHAVERYQPWAIVNAGGYVRVDDAEAETAQCFRDNALGPSVLAQAAARRGIALLTFSSDLVFDGRQQAPYIESDPVSPINQYGKSKVAAERAVMAHYPEALIVRTSAFFGPWDTYNFLTQALAALAQGRPFVVDRDTVITPTYLPDLVHASLDLLIDREAGIWHLCNGQALSWKDLALKAAEMAGIDAGTLEPRTRAQMGYSAARPVYSALTSERAILLPSLDDAISRYLSLCKPSLPTPAIRYAS